MKKLLVALILFLVPFTVHADAPDIYTLHVPVVALHTPAGTPSVVQGCLVSYVPRAPIPGNLFYLTHELRAFVGSPDHTAGDVSGMTDNEGCFTLQNVPHGAYYMVVWDPPYIQQYVMTCSPWANPVYCTPENYKVEIFHVSPGINNLGIIQVSWMGG